MDTFLGIPMTSLALGMVIVVGCILLLLLVLAIRNTILFKMGVRNIVRRPGQTALIILGLMLSTILFTTALGVGDSVSTSLKGTNLANVGNLDEGFSALPVTGRANIPNITPHEIQLLTTALHNESNVDTYSGAMITPQQSVGAFNVTSQQVSAENVILAVPPDFDAVWGPLQDNNGKPLHFADLKTGSVFLNQSLAQSMNTHAGDQLTLLIAKQPYHVTVQAILNTDINPAIGNGAGNLTIIMPLAQFQQITQQPNAVNVFFIKNKGLGGLDDMGANNSKSDAVTTSLRNQFPFDAVTPFKENAIAVAVAAGATVTLVMFAFGLLLMLAGILLIYLIFVLLAGERRAELGMSRAIGMLRRQLIQMFVFEGLVYGLCSVLIGLPIGIAITALIVYIVNNTPSPLIGIQIHLNLAISGSALSIAFCLGLFVTIFVITFSAFRISRMNVVSAVRGLKDEANTHQKSLVDLSEDIFTPFSKAGQEISQGHVLRFLYNITLAPLQAVWKLTLAFCTRGPLTLLLGIFLAAIGIQTQLLLLYTVGASLILIGICLLIHWLLLQLPKQRAIADRVSYSLLALILLFYWAKPFGPVEKLFGLYGLLGLDHFQAADSGQLFLSIIAITAGTIWLIMYNGDLLVKGVMLVANYIPSFRPIARTSMSYPLYYKLRTGLTVTMFALVTFIMVSVVVLSNAYQQNAQVDRWTGGWQIQTDSPGLPPNLIPQVQANPKLSSEIDKVSWEDIQDSRMQLLLPGKQPYVLPYGLARAADDTFLSKSGSIHFQARAAGYNTDQAVWDGVKNQEGLAVLHGSLGAFDIHTPLASSPLQNLANGFQPFDAQIQDAQGGPVHTVKVIGILPTLFQWPGIFMSLHTGEQVFTDPHMTPKWYLFRLKPGISDAKVQQDLNQIYGSTYGLQAELVSSKLNTGVGFLENLTAFLTGYLALGLVIGICGLGIISSLSVVERMQQIGMLRALGYRRSMVQRSFLTESGFITVLGLLLGSILGIWAIYQAVSITFLDSDTIHIPFLEVGLILIGTYLATLLTTFLPSRRAAKVRPAVALRYE